MACNRSWSSGRRRRRYWGWRWSRCGIAPRPVKIGTGKTGAVRYRRDEYMEWIRAG